MAGTGITHLVRRANNKIALLQEPQVGTALSSQADNFLATLELAELRPPFHNTLVDHILQRLDADRARLFPFTPETQKSELRTDRLATAGWRADEDVVVGGVQRLEDLRLDLVEGLERRGVYAFEFLVVKR